jgi:hypothetical protein
LYERAATVRRAEDEDEGQCVTHPDNVAAGTCHRCGNFYCSVCRTRWRRQLLCLACLQRALETREASPEEARAHYLQALWSLICGIGGWAAGLLGVVLMAVGLQAGPQDPSFLAVVLGFFLILGAPAFAVPGLGLGATAIRARGDHLILATAGMVLSALMAGAVVGVICLGIWRS